MENPNLTQVLLSPPILERICAELSFEDTNQLRQTLKQDSLNCTFPVDDVDQHVQFLKPVNSATNQLYFLISKFGSQQTLYKLAKTGNIELIKVLLATGFDINFPVTSHLEHTALSAAVLAGQVETVKFLLQAGAKVDTKGYGEGTALFSAAEKGNLEMIQILLAAGANVNAVNGFSNTPLFKAIQNNHLEAVRLLVDRGTKINTHNYWNDTPLIWAVENRHFGIVKFLVEKGADLNAVNNNGDTALDKVLRLSQKGFVKDATENWLEIAEYLKQHGAI